MFDLLTGTWTKLLEEYTPNDYRVLDEKSNSTDFLDGKKVSFGLESKKGHINFSFDLGIANYPKQYFVISRIFQIFLPNCAITDYSYLVTYLLHNTICHLFQIQCGLMPGEEKTSEWRMNSNPLIDPNNNVTFSSNGTDKINLVFDSEQNKRSSDRTRYYSY